MRVYPIVAMIANMPAPIPCEQCALHGGKCSACREGLHMSIVVQGSPAELRRYLGRDDLAFSLEIAEKQGQ